MNVKIDGLFAGYSEFENNDIQFSIFLTWEDEEKGFGEIRINQDSQSLYIDSELMGKEFIKSILGALVDQAEVIGVESS